MEAIFTLAWSLVVLVVSLFIVAAMLRGASKLYDRKERK